MQVWKSDHTGEEERDIILLVAKKKKCEGGAVICRIILGRVTGGRLQEIEGTRCGYQKSQASKGREMRVERRGVCLLTETRDRSGLLPKKKTAEKKKSNKV